MKNFKINELVTSFICGIREQNLAIEQGNPQVGNKCALLYCAAAKELLSRGKDGLEAFSALLEHSNIFVRTMAAAFLIPFKTIESKAVLELSAESLNTAGLGAKIALRRWKEEGRGVDLE